MKIRAIAFHRTSGFAGEDVTLGAVLTIGHVGRKTKETWAELCLPFIKFSNCNRVPSAECPKCPKHFADLSKKYAYDYASNGIVSQLGSSARTAQSLIFNSLRCGLGLVERMSIPDCHTTLCRVRSDVSIPREEVGILHERDRPGF